MGLLRTAAVIAVGVSLLPSDREKQEQLYQRAAAAASWTITFCERNEATCQNARQFWSQFSQKAEFGAKLAIDVVRDESGPGRTIIKPVPASEKIPPRALEGGPIGTLTRDDLKPQWRGKIASKGGM
jgi:hypothetical protein